MNKELLTNIVKTDNDVVSINDETSVNEMITKNNDTFCIGYDWYNEDIFIG